MKDTCAVMAMRCLKSARSNPEKRDRLLRRAKVWAMLAKDKAAKSGRASHPEFGGTPYGNDLIGVSSPPK